MHVLTDYGAGFEFNVSRLQNAIYFSVIAMSKKSHFTIFAMQNFVQNMNVLVFFFVLS